jgi:hypothetical protein
LASLGAQEMPRSAFLARMAQHLAQPSPDWTAQALDGRELGRAYGREFGRSLAAMESFP